MTGPVAVHLPFLPTAPDQIDPLVEVLNGTDGVRLWLAQSLTVEPHQLLANAFGRGLRVPVGTCVTLLPLRHPYEAAQQARSLAFLSGRPVVAGFGPGSADLQRALLGRRYPSPLTAVREHLGTIRTLLDGDVADTDGDHVTAHAALAPMSHPRIDLGLGVLRPAMARLAGEIADVAITWLCPPSYLRDVLVPELRTSADRAGRPPPRIVAVVHAAQRRPRRDPAELALSVCRAHLQAPHYGAMLRAAGIDVDPHDPAAGAAALVDHRVFLTGSRAEIAAGVAEYHAAGVDEVVVNLSGVGARRGPDAATRELGELLPALGVTGPRPRRRPTTDTIPSTPRSTT